jgi:hypothetical protein
VEFGDVSGGGGASAFIDLSDVPPSYATFRGQVPTVNDTEDGLIFTVPVGQPPAPVHIRKRAFLHMGS